MLFLPTLTPPFRQLYHTMTNPARLSGLLKKQMVFAITPRQIINNEIIPARLPGLCHLDNFIVT